MGERFDSSKRLIVQTNQEFASPPGTKRKSYFTMEQRTKSSGEICTHLSHFIIKARLDKFT